MAVINLVVNVTRVTIELFLAYYSIMEPGAVSYCTPAMERVVTHDSMYSARIIIICFKKLGGVKGVVNVLT